MKATDALKHEHQVILMVLGAAERHARAIAEGGSVDVERVASIVDFVRTFADRCHHAKEEDLLFARMTDRGFPRDVGPVAMMMHEHELGRAYIRAVDGALEAAGRGDAAAARTVGENLSSYARLLRAHINKEDTILYPMADEMLTDEDQAELEAAFARVEREAIGEGVHETYHRLAHELAGA